MSAAMTDLGYCYEKGCGVEQSWEQAFSWYRRGAECGNLQIQMHNLGWIAMKGLRRGAELGAGLFLVSQRCGVRLSG